ncbi:uncharacterized protein LOC107041748 isoform X2 [Diachasma alloeum]|uniref:uncharacterized protein LOC107041748 isoform X2 n=1 Tax=Diachasma alloeum TaxID=454923 RepID=UPI00073837C4|nr:uncharacterized protein LOC107041748 isoform X2 [Diachasma alloeum]
MDIQVSDTNGGNAEVARTESNLQAIVESKLMAEQTLNSDKLQSAKKMDEDEVNGEDKSVGKKLESAGKRRMRQSKSNSTSSVEADAKPKAKGVKRKLLEPDGINEDESAEFVGFSSESIIIIETGLQILQKLIVEAELEESNAIKRRRASSKGIQKNLLSKITAESLEKETTDDNKSISITSEEKPKIKDDKEPKKIDTITTDPPNFCNNPESKGASSNSQNVDMSNPLYKEPFKFGWKREMIYKGGFESTAKKSADIYYYSPKGKKVKSLREVAECLTTKELSLDNFTFYKEPIGIDDPSMEVIRDAKRLRSESAGGQVTPTKKSLNKRSSLTRKVLTPPPCPPKTVKISPSKGTTPAGFKVKVASKRGAQKKEVKPSKETEQRPPQWSSHNVTRKNQAAAEKVTSPKNKRILRAKLQEPCSIRCSMSMGLIPSLQCRICLCLYHPECVGGKTISANEEYVCKNCQMELEPSERHQQQPLITPPALIPISMLGSHTIKSKLPKPHQSSKPETEEPLKDKIPMSNLSEVPSVIDNVDTSLSSWFSPPGKKFLHNHGGCKLQPAQNIAKMGGKRYIVVPKNNDMAVQPAIPIRPDRTVENQRDFIRENSLININLSTENSISSRRSSQSGVKYTPDKENEITKKVAEAMDVESPLNDSISKDMGICCNKVKSSGVEPAVQTMEVHMDVEAVELDKNLEIEWLDGSRLPPAESLNGSHSSQIEPMIALTNKNEVESEMAEERGEKVECNNKVQKAMETPLLPPENQKNEEVENFNTKCDSSTKKKIPPMEVDPKQYFMVSVCAGYHALSRIFQYLKVQELLRAARVCRMWRDLAAHPALWKTVRMKNSQVADWDGLAASLKRHGTQHLDLRKMLVAGEADNIWDKFVSILPNVPSLTILELCRCPASVVEEIFKCCPQLEVMSAMAIKCDALNIESLGNVKHLKELKLKAISGMSLQEDFSPLGELKHLTQLNLTSVKELGKKKIEVLGTLTSLETLELGECSDFPDRFGTDVLLKLTNLERLRLEKGQGSCCTFDILEGVSKLGNLRQLELVNFDVKNGFDKCLANCKNIKRLLIIPTYISQSATSNNMVLGGVTKLSDNLTHFVWGVTLELLRVTELFVDQCNQMNKQVSGDSIPVLKPVPCLKLIEDIEVKQDAPKEERQSTLTNPQVDILPLPQLQKLLLTALPKTRVKILKIPFHATWRQSISDNTSP